VLRWLKMAAVTAVLVNGPPAVLLMGPTASGKTAMALALAERLRCHLISVDSAQVYRGLDIGTAKPDAALRARHPHALIDIRDPGENYSAADFRRDALAEMEKAIATGRLPLLVGGTGLYFRALERGLSRLPPADPALRRALAEELARLGPEPMHARLRALRPEVAARIAPGDRQRILRALELIALGHEVPVGRAWLGGADRPPFRLLRLALLPSSREELHRRIEERLRHMFRLGFVEEVEALRARGDLHLGLPALRAVGYRQIWEGLERGASRSEMFERALFATRQLAKRQITWLRGEPAYRILPPACESFLAAIRLFLTQAQWARLSSEEG
jgi:tRNA dimethylallyltransferase